MSKGRLIQYSGESDLMNISIIHGDETFKFNLNEEVIVNENRINKEIKEQPSAYAFLGMLHKKLIRKAKDKERTMKKTYAIMFIKFKEEIDDQTNRPTANDLAKEKVIASFPYQKSVKEYIRVQHESDILEVCVLSFEQRASLIQTLSANIRKTN